MPFQGILILVFSLLFAIILGLLIFFLRRNLIREKPERKKSGSGLVFVIALVAFLLFFFFWISYAYQGSPTPIQKPLPQDLIGTWALTEQSKKELLKLGKLATTNQISISGDGSCSLLQMPKLMVSSSGYDVQFLSGTCSWVMEKNINNEWAINLSLLLNGSKNFEQLTLNISGKRPPFTLYQPLYDELSAWVYSKKE
jgi:predicted PurR-regulated permease PerM